MHSRAATTTSVPPSRSAARLASGMVPVPRPSAFGQSPRMVAQAKRAAGLFPAAKAGTIQRQKGGDEDPWKGGNPNRGKPAPTGRYINRTGHHDATKAKWRARSVVKDWKGKRGQKK